MDIISIEKLEHKIHSFSRHRFCLEFWCFEKMGIHPGQCHMISLIHRYPGRSQKELADIINIKPATMTVMVKKLEKAELVKRIPHETDQRMLKIYLTEKGDDVFIKLDEIRKKMQMEYYKNFTEEELHTLYELIKKMDDNIKRIKDDV